MTNTGQEKKSNKKSYKEGSIPSNFKFQILAEKKFT